MKFKDLYESALGDGDRNRAGYIDPQAFIAADRLLDLSDVLAPTKDAVEAALDRFKLRGPQGSEELTDPLLKEMRENVMTEAEINLLLNNPAVQEKIQAMREMDGEKDDDKVPKDQQDALKYLDDKIIDFMAKLAVEQKNAE